MTGSDSADDSADNLKLVPAPASDQPIYSSGHVVACQLYIVYADKIISSYIRYRY